MTQFNRRAFLAASAASFAGASGVLGGLTQRKAWAANVTGYKAMVCIFLKGGLDHNDTVLPVDAASHTALASIRPGVFGSHNVGSGTSSRDIANLIKLNPVNAGDFNGREFGLPPQMGDIADIFDRGEAAVIGNVGPLIEPTGRDGFENGTVELPARLFSHNDQQSTWMSLDVEGSRYGWGGRFADAAMASDPNMNRTFAAITTAGNEVFLSGENVQQFIAPSNGGGGLDLLTQRWIIGGSSRHDAMREQVEQFYNRSETDATNLFARDVVNAQALGVANGRAYAEALSNTVPLTTEFPGTSLGGQLSRVADAITASDALGVRRQVFMVTGGGYDTHDNQANSLVPLQTEINDAIAAFRSAMIERGNWNDVVVFTASDFGRTMIDNGDGTDHGWGAHHFVLGGAIQGRAIYGDLPAPDLDSQFYTESRGRLIPSVSVEQYAATMGRWFGLTEEELLGALPNLSRFQTQDLGFFGSLSG